MLEGLTPTEAENDNNMSLVMKAKLKYLQKFKKRKPRYSVGTYVRIKKATDKFSRSYKQTFTEEVFRISGIKVGIQKGILHLTNFREIEIQKNPFFV